MSKKEKLISRLLAMPKGFTFDEAKSLLELHGYLMHKSGKTSGSRICFTRGHKIFRMHKPHPRKELLQYQVKEIIDELKGENLI